MTQPPPGSPTNPNEVAIILGSTGIAGWEDVQITLGIENCPNSFAIGLTEQYPGVAAQITVKPGTPCKVMIGKDAVITGYVDRYESMIGPATHEIRIMGRGLCEDIVDSSAVITGMQKTGSSLVALAKELVAPFGINVVAPDGDGVQFYLFAVNLGETPYELIERVARYEGFLVYEDSAGNLVIARAGTKAHASGFQLGRNVQAAQVRFTVDERFTDYIPVLFASDTLSDIGKGGNYGGEIAHDMGMQSLKRADGKPRYRPHFIISEQIRDGQYIAGVRAQWECNRRRGRSQAVRVTCDSWRDSSGKLWTPNYLAPIDLPALKLTGVSWVIASATFSRSLKTGSTASLELMPAEAFTPDPTPPQMFDSQIYRAAHPSSDPNFNTRANEQTGGV